MINMINTKKTIIISIIFIMMATILPQIIHADWVISTQGEPGVLVMDDNGYAYWGNVVVTVQDTNVSVNYDNYGNDTIYGKWVFGLLFIVIGMILAVGILFSDRIKSYI